MNQILDHSGPKKKKAPSSNSDDIKSKIKVFAIIIFIFGIALIATGIYYVVNNNKMKEQTETPQVVSEPTIDAVEQEESKVSITVTHDKTIEKVLYCWDDSEKVVRKGVSDEKTINISDIGIPTGTHTLNITVVDVDSKEFVKSFEFTSESGIDTVDPKIDIVIEGTRIEIVAEDETELQYVTYRIGDGEEQTIYPEDADKKRISKVLDLQLTQTTEVYVTAVDTANNAPRQQKTIVVYQKPEIKFSATSDASEIIVNVTSVTPLTKIKVILNGEEQVLTMEDNKLEYMFKVKVTKVGRNDITVEAYTQIEDGEEIYQTNTGYINYGQ